METVRKYKLHIQLFVVFALILANSITYSQCDFSTDFESGVLTDWTILAGNNVISTQQVHTGNYALKMTLSGNYPIIQSNQNMFGCGVYTAWFWISGPVTDAYFRFYYQNSNNFYQLAMMPLNTDNPKLKLVKLVNGNATTLAEIPPVFNVNQWFEMKVERELNGDIKVYINGALQISVIDATFIMPSNVEFLAYDETTYLDDFCYISCLVSNPIDLGNNVIACEGDIVQLDAGSGLLNYVWNNGLAYGNTIDVSTTGLYSVQAVDSMGMTLSDTIFVLFNPLPLVDLGADTTVCPGEIVDLHSGNMGQNYLWSTGETSSNISINTEGLYWIQVSDQYCTSSDTIMVSFYPLPYVDLGEDTSICDGDIINLSSGSSGYSYSWSTGETTSTISINTSGIYWVLVSDQNCSSSDTILVSPLPGFNGPFEENIGVCEGEKALLDAGSLGTAFLWSTGEITQIIEVNYEGVYSVTIYNDICTITDSVMVFLVPNPTVSLGSDITLCGGNTLVLDADNPGSNFLWSTGETTQTIVVGGSNQIIWVEVEKNGCTAKDAISIVECDNNYGVPTGFSPNNDGENDILYVYGQNFQEMEFTVFNRFGQMIFSSDRQDIGWDGTYRGKDCEMDVYVWVLKLIFYNGRAISDQGNVSLLR
ncbi:MAG: gliding motility-associated C-terminal domain-containing protein [Bacteroidales bacterium]|nr:gliding motility-associated C-terminal domain-containing protein [Bacteroidales bacterium]MCF8455035.1 gliding motility-associated C-terminal domain-containing protein [Bacteroidales bacterium]